MKRKIIPILFLGLLLCSQSGLAQDLGYIRTNYPKAATDKSVCQSLIENLSEGETSNLRLAYLGALEMIWAKHTNNPFSKLSTFRAGKKKIETAIDKDSNNIEIRYLRLSIQKNAPWILGYNDAIECDKLFLKKNLDKVLSKDLKTRIKNILNG